jgi:hypothetical protein
VDKRRRITGHNLTQDPFAFAVCVKPLSDGTTVEIVAQASTPLAAKPSIQIRQADSSDPISVALTAVTVSTGQYALNANAAVNISYQPEAVAGLDDSALRIYHWDQQAQQWVDDGGAVNLEHQVVSTQVEHLGTFVLAAERKLYLPFIVKWRDETIPGYWVNLVDIGESSVLTALRMRGGALGLLKIPPGREATQAVCGLNGSDDRFREHLLSQNSYLHEAGFDLP